MRLLKQSTARNVAVFITSSTDHVAGKTGLAAGLTIYACKDNGTPAAITPTVSEMDATNMPGWYNLALTTTHTNTLGDLALHITGTGADPADIVFQVVLDLPGVAQTGDSFARLGAPAGASVSADVAAVKAETASIQSDTNDLQSRTPAALVGGRMDVSVGAMAANVMTAAAAAADLTTELQSGLATASALATVAGYIDTEVAAILAIAQKLDTALELDGAVYRFTLNALELAPSGGASAADIADAVWDEATAGHQTAGTTGKALTSASSAGDPWTTEFDGKTAGEILQHLAAFAAGKTTIVKIGSRRHTITFRAIDDSADRIVATVDNGQRTALTLTP